MSTADLRRPDTSSAYSAGSRDVTPDYHALGTFSETWSFLEFFLGRCLSALGANAAPGLQAKLESMDAAAQRLEGPHAHEVAALAAEVRALAGKREAALQDLARASLNRMGLGQFDIDGALPHDGDKTLEALHMRTCDLVRRTVMLLCALQKAGR